jgi:ATP-binding cassette subfamily C (CFTR/MRP) protein 1
MNAVERVYEYSNEGSIPQEAAYEDSESTATVPTDWPARGGIEFKDVVMRRVAEVEVWTDRC